MTRNKNLFIKATAHRVENEQICGTKKKRKKKKKKKKKKKRKKEGKNKKVPGGRTSI